MSLSLFLKEALILFLELVWKYIRTVVETASVAQTQQFLIDLGIKTVDINILKEFGIGKAVRTILNGFWKISMELEQLLSNLKSEESLGS